jgi:hypothetical protein
MPVDDSAGQSPLGDPDQGDSNRGTSGQSGSDRGAAGNAAPGFRLVLLRRVMAPMVGPLVAFG